MVCVHSIVAFYFGRKAVRDAANFPRLIAATSSCRYSSHLQAVAVLRRRGFGIEKAV